MVLRRIVADSIEGPRMNKMTRALGALLLLTSPLVGAATSIDSYSDVQWETYTHAVPDFSLQYPYELRAATPSRPGEVFSASGPARLPTISVAVVPRQNGVTLAQAAAGAAKFLAPNGTIKSQRSVDLDGVPGQMVTIERSELVPGTVALFC
jgi:hypothetical protein